MWSGPALRRIAIVVVAAPAWPLAVARAEPVVTVEFHPFSAQPAERLAEPFQLDMSPEALAVRECLSRFSQISERLPARSTPFRLPTPQPSPGPVFLPNATEEESVVPILPQFTTTAGFEGDLSARRTALIHAVEHATPEERVTRQLDYAQFLIARMMLPEARSVVDSVLAFASSASPAVRDRALGYRAILASLGEGQPVDLPTAWETDPFWPVVISGGPVSEDKLRAAVEALQGQSRAVATAAVPKLFDLALAGGHVDLAADLLAAESEGTDLEGTPQLDLMRGRLALSQGAEDLAFDTLARVAEGQDRPAVEARVLLADMVVARNDPELLPQITSLLIDGLSRWKGGDAALQLRTRLATVAEDSGDIPTAVLTWAMILREYPGSSEARQAEDRIAGLIPQIVKRVADPALPLETVLAEVRRLDPALQERGDWIAVRVSLAQRLAATGLEAAARAEYAEIARTSADGTRQAEPAVLSNLILGHAELLLQNGDAARARAVLDKGLRGTDSAVAIAALRLKASATAILPGRLLSALNVQDASGIDDPAAQLALANIAVAAGEEDAALQAFDRGLPAASPGQRLTAIRVASEADEAGRAMRYASGLAGERADLQRAVVNGLVTPIRPRGPLSVGDASRLITAAADAGQAIDRLLSEGAKQ